MNIKGENLIEYVALGAGAVALPVIASKVDFLASLMSNQIFSYDIAGVTVGSVVLAAVGIGLVKQLFYSK